MRSRTAPVSKGTQLSKSRSGPAGVGSTMQQISDTVTRITGRAYVGEVSTKGKVINAGGNCLGLVFDINPVLLNDRVAVVASTYEKYVYHGVKFTYVPQCSTATQGSVGLAFDRDPLMYSAFPTGTQFLSEVMSYEHAVLTPCWTGTQTSYARDPQELKTWFMGGTDATLTTRETSQGNLLVYLSNVLPNVGLGFIVMDYVLDLVAPNLLPNKQGVTNVRTAPSQWMDYNGEQGGVNSTFMPVSVIEVPVGPLASIRRATFLPTAGWRASNPALASPGNVGEYHIGGVRADNGALLVVPQFRDPNDTLVSIKGGQKLYFCTHMQNTQAQTDELSITFHSTLSSARAAQSMYLIPIGTLNFAVLPDLLYANDLVGAYVGGWMRLITPAAATVVNTA